MIPVITVDGPSGSGKGTLSQFIAGQLKWHLLDSGAIYRVLALGALRHEVALDDIPRLVELGSKIDVRFEENQGKPVKVILEDKDVTHEVRTEECGKRASIVAQIPKVREALFERQKAFRKMPGLVADGRDMGTKVFPDANLKIFLEASSEERARRRWSELQEKGLDVSLNDIFSEIEARDMRDRQRKASPLVPAIDAFILDTTDMNIQEVCEAAMIQIKAVGLA